MSSQSPSDYPEPLSPERQESPLSPYNGNSDSMAADSDETSNTTPSSGSSKRKEDMTLPLPPGALPPRKRAKTKDEKEQRRIERIMRNRQAAHASREKKRRHVEELEKKCVDLSTENDQLQGEMRQLKSSYSEASDHSMYLRHKLTELLNSVESAKKSGDINSIDISTIRQEIDSKLTATINPYSTQESFVVPKLIDNDPDARSETGSISAPSLSSSTAPSPTSSSLDIMVKQEEKEEEDNVVISLPEKFPTFGMVDYRTHHPAEVMGKDQQRRLSTKPRTLPTLSSLTT